MEVFGSFKVLSLLGKLCMGVFGLVITNDKGKYFGEYMIYVQRRFESMDFLFLHCLFSRARGNLLSVACACLRSLEIQLGTNYYLGRASLAGKQGC